MSKKLVSLFLALALMLACVPVLAEGGITVTDMTGWTALQQRSLR